MLKTLWSDFKRNYLNSEDWVASAWAALHVSFTFLIATFVAGLAADWLPVWIAVVFTMIQALRLADMPRVDLDLEDGPDGLVHSLLNALSEAILSGIIISMINADRSVLFIVGAAIVAVVTTWSAVQNIRSFYYCHLVMDSDEILSRVSSAGDPNAKTDSCCGKCDCHN